MLWFLLTVAASFGLGAVVTGWVSAVVWQSVYVKRFQKVVPQLLLELDVDQDEARVAIERVIKWDRQDRKEVRELEKIYKR